MQRVYQTQYGERGNCLAACISMLTGVPLAEVPNFCHEGSEPWWDRYAAWLNGHGFAPMAFDYGEPGVPLADCPQLAWARDCAPRLGWIGMGTSHCGAAHAVVFLGGELFHDPAPPGFSTPGLARITDANFILQMHRS